MSDMDRLLTDEEVSEVTDLIMEGDYEINQGFVRNCVVNFLCDMWTFEDYCLFTGIDTSEEE